eukprot:TRINITY_DN3994_c0_g1_i3.p1 TRINITY_DN3994_c0_g1~~TRINITY_DN3994_c0_g1_i3.p1  ORF type:complete len:734 (-),score=86.11 TRINITY_DN3994_c0_g1_i3:300-2210(-)
MVASTVVSVCILYLVLFYVIAWDTSPRFFEIGALVFFMLIMGCGWFNALFYFDGMLMRQRSLAVYLILYNTIPCIFSMRIIPNIILSCWIFMGNVLAGYAASHVHGDTLSSRQIGLMAFWGLIYFIPARMNQSRLFHLFERQKDGVEEASAMEKLLTMLGDGLVWLMADGNTVCKSDKRLETHFRMAEIVGKTLKESLFANEDESARVANAIKLSKTVPTQITTTITCKKEDASLQDTLVDVDALFVSLGIKHTASARAGSFLVCFRIVRESTLPSQEADDPPELADTVNRNDNNPRTMQPWILRSAMGEDSMSWTSIAETTSTGFLFDQLQRALRRSDADGFSDMIGHVIDLGIREHWLLPSSSIHAMPDAVLGTGSFGKVIKAKHHGLTVAVKVPLQKANNLRALSTFMNELRVLRFVRHPHVVFFFGATINALTFEVALVFECVNGPSLDTCLDCFRDAFAKRNVILDVACAIRHMHAQRPAIIHGDLKTANVLLDVQGGVHRAKLADFGLSTLLSKNKTIRGGSLAWLAPEIIREGASATPTASADMFSFGRLIFCIVAGTNEFCDFKDRETIVHMAMMGIVMPLRPLPLDVPLAVLGVPLCERCSLPNPDDRPTIVEVHVEVETWTHKVDL